MLKYFLVLLAAQMWPAFSYFDEQKHSIDDLISRAYTQIEARNDLCTLIQEGFHIENGHLYQIDLSMLFPKNNVSTEAEVITFLRVARKQNILIPDTVSILANKYNCPQKPYRPYKNVVQTTDIRNLRALDVLGHKKATYRLGCIYNGDITAPDTLVDYEQARLYFLNCLNTKDARLKLAEIYENGLGVPQDRDISLKHLTDACKSKVPGIAQKAHLMLASFYRDSDFKLTLEHYRESGELGARDLKDFILCRSLNHPNRQELLTLAIELKLCEVDARFCFFNLTKETEILRPLLVNSDQGIQKKAHLRLASHYQANGDCIRTFEHSHRSGRYTVAELSNFVFSQIHDATNAQALLKKAIELQFEENRARYSLFQLLISRDNISKDEIDYAQQIFRGISYDYLCFQICFDLKVPIALPKLAEKKSSYSGQYLAFILYQIATTCADNDKKILELAKQYAEKTKDTWVLGAIAFLQRDWHAAISHNYKRGECYTQLYATSTDYAEKFRFYHLAMHENASFTVCPITQQVIDFCKRHNCSFDYSAGVILHNSLNNKTAAIDFFKREVSNNPSNPNANLALASIFLSPDTPDYIQGKKYLVQLNDALKKHPELSVQTNLNRCLFTQVLRRKNMAPSESIFYATGMVFYNARKYDQSQALFSWSLEEDPSNGHAHYMLGTICFNHLKDNDKTREHYVKASGFGITEATDWLKKYPENSKTEIPV